MKAFFSNYGCDLDGLQLWHTRQKWFKNNPDYMCNKCINRSRECFQLDRNMPQKSALGYLVTRSFAEKLLTHWEDPRTAYYDKTGARGAVDVSWNALGKKHRWFTLALPMVFPIGGKSDIS